jgi:predicted peroxiredoxin
MQTSRAGTGKPKKERDVGNLLYVGTYGSDDPTRATMPILGSTGALDKGHKPSVFLMGEAVLLMKDSLVDTLHGVGFPPLRQLMLQVVGSGVPFYI